MTKVLPRYPIYIPSKGRYETCLTAKFLIKDRVPFYLVVEPQEYFHYVAAFGEEHVLELPFSDQGSVIPARNWIKAHATDAGHERHWQLDDNIYMIRRRWKDQRIPAASGVALRTVEDFVDRYQNIAVAGLNYRMFVVKGAKMVPFFLNCHVYSCCLILNSLPNEWRGPYNEDTDMCLQVLADGWCTVLVNAFLIDKVATMMMKGGNTDELYFDDGRLKMARTLERRWPGVVTVNRRFNRPQHVVFDSWKKFDTPLKLKDDVDLTALPAVNEYGMQLKAKKTPKSKALRDMVSQWEDDHPLDL